MCVIYRDFLPDNFNKNFSVSQMHPELSYYYYITLFWSFDLWHVMDVLPILLREDAKIWRNDFTLMHPKVGAKRLFLKAVEEIKTTLSQWLSVNPIAEPSSSKSYYWNLPLLSICFCPDKGLFSWFCWSSYIKLQIL